MFLSLAAIFVGASIGASFRWMLGLGCNLFFPAVPPGTLLANLLGGYLAGVAIACFANNAALAAAWRLFIMTGFLGSLTTFSTFSVETLALFQQGRVLLAMAAILAHVAGSLLMTFLGLMSVTMLRVV